VLPPNLGVITSFSNKEFVSMSPSLSLKYANFSYWKEALPKYLLYAHLWRYTGEPILSSGLYHKEYNALSQCTSVYHETLVSLKASHSSDHYNISWSNSTPDQTVHKSTYCLCTSITSCNILCFCSVDCNRLMFLTSS
jgi:hypothetical protein